MQDLNKHMTLVHQETDSIRIERLTRTFEAMERKTQESSVTNYKLYDCSECGDLFVSSDQLNSHIRKHHKTQLQGFIPVKVQEEFISPAVKILPDHDFLTKNTADLKAMLESIPKEALFYEEDVFEKDFKLVLNSVKEEQKSDDMTSYCCEECNFRATSKRCLSAHNTFVHGYKFYKCEVCPMKTRTEQALNYHVDIKHNSYLEVKEEVIDVTEKKRQRLDPQDLEKDILHFLFVH